MVFIKGKNGHERNVPIDQEIISEVYRFVMSDGMNVQKKYVFLNPDTKKIFSDQHLRDIVNDYMEASEIQKHITPHSFRRSFATNLYNNGTDVKKIQKVMGHKNVKTTLGYIQLTKLQI